MYFWGSPLYHYH
nr:unnamed protein product [Callosobruchus analis]